MSLRLRFASPLLLLTFAACQTVTATPRPGAASVPPRDDRCTVEFWPGAERPSRAVDELADVKVKTPAAAHVLEMPVDARELLREKACSVGADAVVDLHEEVGADATYLVGTAVRYRPP